MYWPTLSMSQKLKSSLVRSIKRASLSLPIVANGLDRASPIVSCLDCTWG